MSCNSVGLVYCPLVKGPKTRTLVKKPELLFSCRTCRVKGWGNAVSEDLTVLQKPKKRYIAIFFAVTIQGGSDKSGTLSMLHNRNKK
jgi:hypothetical protein